MIAIALALLQAQVPAVPAGAPSPAAEALGVRLARAGSMMSLLPLVAQKDTEALIEAHPDLSPAERQALRDTARRTLDAGMTRIATAFGRAYARRLPLADLEALVAQAESPVQGRLRAIQPGAMAEALATLGTLDFRKDTAAAFCHDTGKLCTP